MKCENCEIGENEGYLIGEKEVCLDCYSADIDNVFDTQRDKEVMEKWTKKKE